MAEPLDQKFWQIGDGERGYVSRNGGFGDPSPAYVVTTAARRLIRDGHPVALPDGYSQDTLDQMAWLLGQVVPDGVEVRVSARQAGELAQIAGSVLEDYRQSVSNDEAKDCEFVVRLAANAADQPR